jgi:hypothetical protein
MNKKHEYDWDGEWAAPGYGTYAIYEDGEELEPGRVIELLKQYQDLLEQVKHKQFFKPLPDSLIQKHD